MKQKHVTYLILAVGGAILALQGLLAWGLSDFNIWEFLTFTFHVFADAALFVVGCAIAYIAFAYALKRVGWYDQFND